MNRAYRSAAHPGMVIAVTLVCLLVVATLGAALVRALVDNRRQSRREQYRVQAFWLAESAVGRAARQVASSPDYQGERWQVDRDTLGGRWPGSVLIRVEKVDSDETLRRVVIESRYPEDAERRVIEQIEVTVKSTAPGESS